MNEVIRSSTPRNGGRVNPARIVTVYSIDGKHYRHHRFVFPKSRLMVGIAALIPVILIAGIICGFTNKGAAQDDTIITEYTFEDYTQTEATPTYSADHVIDRSELTDPVHREYDRVPETVEVTEATPSIDDIVLDEDEVYALAKVIYNEARGCSTTEQAAVAWCVLNRVDSTESYFPDTVIGVITQKNAFAYSEDTPLKSSLVTLAADVLYRWKCEALGCVDVGRVLPSTYLYFTGDGQHNHFTEDWKGTETWDWSLESPYEEVRTD